LQLGSTGDETDLVEKVSRLQDEVQGMIKHPDVNSSERLSRIMVELDGAKARGEKNQAAFAEKEVKVAVLQEKVKDLQASYDEALSKLRESDKEKGRLSRRITELEAAQQAVSALDKVDKFPDAAGGDMGPSEREAALIAEVQLLRQEIAELQKVNDGLYDEIDLRPTGCTPFFSSKKKKRRPTKTPGGLAAK